MKKDDISRLLQRYLSAVGEGKEPYFDADEIDELLNSFEESDDYTYYDEVLALGLKLHPGNTDLQIRRCRQLMDNEDFHHALALMNNIAETDHQDLDLLRLECYCLMKQYPKVVEYTEQLIAAECEYIEPVFEYIAPVLNDLEMHTEARDYIDRGLALFPDNFLLKEELCYNLEATGDIRKAIDICNDLIDQNPYSNDSWFTLGRLYSMVAEYDKAIEAFDFALTCDESDVELKMLKAYCLYMNESYEKAIEVYNEISDEELVKARIKPYMAECYIKLENYEKGYELLKDVLTDKGEAYEPSAYVHLIRCCLETHREDTVPRILQKAAELYPDNIRILSLMAISYMDDGNEEMAMHTTDKIFDLLDAQPNQTDNDCESLFRTGQYLYLKGEVDKALMYYNKVLEINPEHPYLHLHLAMAYLSKGDMKRFNEHFKQTGTNEMIEYLKKSGIEITKIDRYASDGKKHIPPEDLVKEFLKNKDNSN